LDASGEATQRQWLAQQLAQADKSTFIIVAVHQPPYSLDSTNEDTTIQTVLVWRREKGSPLVQEFLTVAREVLEQRKKTTDGV
jgi:hypothetical protein